MGGSPAELSSMLATALSTAGGEHVDVADLSRLSAGASRETWRFTADGGSSGRRDLILQRTRPGGGIGAITMEVEDHLLAAAAEAGVPVPPIVLASADLTALGDC